MASTMPVTEPRTGEREIYIDFLRASSLIVVVLFHWAFTMLEFGDTTVRSNSPIGSTRGAWTLTWFLQVMPVFFFVGGYAHWIVWKKVRDRGGGWWAFVAGRLRRLVVPAVAVVIVWVIMGSAIAALRDIHWMSEAVLLIVSPLWFLGIYSVLVLVAPVAIWLHRRWGAIVLVWLVGMAAVLDVLRFGHGQGWAGYANFLLIWGFCHQLGLHYRALVEAPRQVAWMFLWAGLFGLFALTSFGLYPRSMVGVPGDRFSNMGPPTLVIPALLAFQVGLVLLARPWAMRRLAESPRWAGFNEMANRFSLPLYLFHTSAFAAALTLVYVIAEYVPPALPTAEWWWQRPLWVALPALFAIPIVLLASRMLPGGRRPKPVETPAGAERFW